jgi:DNA replication protein DnaC
VVTRSTIPSRNPSTGSGELQHLAIALGRAAVDAGYRVRFFRSDVLIEQLYRGLADNTVSKVIDAILRAEVVVIDELGLSDGRTSAALRRHVHRHDAAR